MRHSLGAWLFIPATAACLFFPAHSHAQTPRQGVPEPLVLEGLGRATIPVDGAWEFHPGDDLNWASPRFDDSQWETMEAGRTWEAQGHRGLTGFAWYRRHIVLPAGAPRDWKLALFLPAVDSACEVYWNGVRVGGIGRVPPGPVWYFPGDQPNGDFTLGPAQSGVLALRVWKAPTVFLADPEEGGLTSIPRMGTAEAIANLEAATQYKWLRGHEFILGEMLLSSIVGLVALLIWLRSRDRMVLLWLAMAMFFPLEGFLVGDAPGAMPFRFAYGSIGVAVGLNDLALWSLLIAFLGLDERPLLVRWTKILVGAEISLDLVDCFFELFNQALPHPRAFLIVDVATTIPAVSIELWGVVLVLAAFRQRLDGARWLLAIAALLADLATAAGDITGLGERWTHWTASALIVWSPLVTIAGSGLSIANIANLLLLISILNMAWHYAQEQSTRQNTLEQEYRSAQELQQVLIPESLPALPGYAVTSAYRPAQEVGGDFFQLIALPAGGALLVIGDVSGKGLPAAMAVALIVGAIRSVAETTDSPAAMLAALNRRLHGRLRGGFATCLALRLDADGGVELANAGHLPPYRNGEEVAIAAAFPLGLTPDAAYQTTALRLAPGDRLTLYTDGLLEARSASGELFGFARIAEILATAPDAEQIAEEAQRFGQEDDITVLTLRFAEE